MGFGAALRSIWENWSTFSGRARRAELIYGLLALSGVGLLTVAVVTAARPFVPVVGIVTLLFFLVAFWPSLAVSVRRLHDSGRSGRWMLLLFVPAAGHLFLLILLLLPSSRGANSYGAVSAQA